MNNLLLLKYEFYSSHIPNNKNKIALHEKIIKFKGQKIWDLMLLKNVSIPPAG